MGKKKSEKMDIVIHVDPEKATMAMATLTVFLAPTMDYIQKSMQEMDAHLNDSFEDDLRSVVLEVYERCVEQTNIRERVGNLLEYMRMSGGVLPPSDKN